MTVTRQSYTETTRQLWRTALWCSTDSEGQPLDSEHDIQDVDPEDVFRLEADYWQFRDRADEILLKHGQGDACLEDFWPTRVEHLFVLCREGHGSGFTDDYLTGSKTHAIAQELERIARSYPPINATAVDGKVFCYWAE